MYYEILGDFRNGIIFLRKLSIATSKYFSSKFHVHVQRNRLGKKSLHIPALQQSVKSTQVTGDETFLRPRD